MWMHLRIHIYIDKLVEILSIVGFQYTRMHVTTAPKSTHYFSDLYTHISTLVYK